MGGIGSGRHWRFDTKHSVTDYRALDVRRWARDGYLEPGNRFGWQWTADGERVAWIRRADTIRERLGWQPGLDGACGGRPKGMHRRNNARLVAEVDRLIDEAEDAFGFYMADHFDRLERKFGG